MRLTEVLKEGKKLVSELVSELDEVELAFYQHNPADIDQITIRVIDEVVPKKADKSKLNELAEKRDELGMRLNALAKKIGDTQAELAEAKAVERTAAIEAYKAESAKQLEQEMKAFQEKFGSNWFQYFLRSYGAYSLAKFAGKEVVRAALENLNSERTKVWRTMKLLEEAERELLVLKQEEGSSKTLGELYEELRGKVCELAGRN